MDLSQSIKRIGIHSIILNQENEILVLKRAQDDINDPDKWDLPGGGVNSNENITDALKREIKEETNLTINNISLIGAYTCDEGRLQLCAISQLENGDLILSSEHSDYEWIPENEFLELKPAGLHLLAGQFFIQNEVKTTTYNELVA